MNREEIYFDCWTNSASGVRNLSWVINGARIREGVEMSYDEEVTHSGVTVAAGERVDKMVVTCCVKGQKVCKTKTTSVIGKHNYRLTIVSGIILSLEGDYLVHLEPGSQEIRKTGKDFTDGRNHEDQKNEVKNHKLEEGIPDSAQIERPEINSKIQVKKIALKTSSLKFVSSGCNNSTMINAIVLLLSTISLFKVI